MNRILIVEDDRDLATGVSLALRDSDTETVTCNDLATARSMLAVGGIDLVLLDINLPDGNGLSLLGEVKESSELPVILLTANDTELDVVTGLERGADDYITKPFSLAILRARVGAQLRHSNRHSSTVVEIGEYLFDFERMEFSHKGELVELSKTEQKLLRLLVNNRGATLSRAAMVDRIWTDGADYVDENALSVTVKRLRDKLDAAQYIKTIYGVGYRWEEV